MMYNVLFRSASFSKRATFEFIKMAKGQHLLLIDLLTVSKIKLFVYHLFYFSKKQSLIVV